MAWRYRGPKGFVSEARYNRYKHLPSYSRLSDAKWNVKARQTRQPEKPTKSAQRNVAKPSGKTESTPSFKAPSSPAEYERMFDAKLKKLSKKKRDEFYQKEYEGPEYETGVDY